MPTQVDTVFDLTTKQGIFDHVATALIKQGRPAMASGGCEYLAPDGCKCAVGHLLQPDRAHEANGEGSVYAESTTRSHSAIRLLDPRIPKTPSVKMMLSDMQNAHDGPAFLDDWQQNWKDGMKSVAASFKLDDTLVAA